MSIPDIHISNANLPSATDGCYREFINRLDSAPFEVTDSEASFIEVILNWPADEPLLTHHRTRIYELLGKYSL